MVVVKKKSKPASARPSSTKSSSHSKSSNSKKKSVEIEKTNTKNKSNSKNKKSSSRKTSIKSPIKTLTKPSRKSSRKPSRKNHKSSKVDIDVSDLEFGTSMHERLDKFETSSDNFGKKLKQMDEKLGLPPLPERKTESVSDVVKSMNKFNSNSNINQEIVDTDFDNKSGPAENKLNESLPDDFLAQTKNDNKFDEKNNSTMPEKKRKGFFSKLFSADKNDSKDRNSNDSNNSKFDSQSEFKIDFDYKPDFSNPKNSDDFDVDLKSNLDALSPSERKEILEEKRELEKLEKLVEKDEEKIEKRKLKENTQLDEHTNADEHAKLDEINMASYKNPFKGDLTISSSGSGNTSDASPSIDGLPRSNYIPEEYRIEKPHQREIALSMDDSSLSGKNNGEKKKKNEKNKKKGTNSTKDNALEDDSETKLLPPASNEFKLNEKKSFFSKLFGSKRHSKSEKTLENSKMGLGQPQSAPEIDKNDVAGKFDIGVKSDNEKENDREINDDIKVTDSVGSPLKAPEIDSNSLSSSSNLDEHANSFLSNSLEAEMDSRNASPSSSDLSTHTNSNPFETDANVNKELEKNIFDKDENVENADSVDAKPNRIDKESDDMVAKENKEKATNEPENLVENKTDNPLTSGKTSSLNISKLEAQKEKLKRELKEIDEKLKNNKATFEDTTARLDNRERMLDKRERELDDRESILLTLQTDLIRERKELDKREFEFFMNQEKSSFKGKPTITLSLENDMKALPKGMSDERMKLEQMLNQTRTLAINKEFEKAKFNYNRLVEKFHNLELSPSEKKAIHLSIKELFNDINILMNSDPGSDVSSEDNLNSDSSSYNPNNVSESDSNNDNIISNNNINSTSNNEFEPHQKNKSEDNLFSGVKNESNMQ